MKDQFDRHIDYVRISITDRCNLRCTYCMPEDGIQQVDCETILSYEEIIKACQAFALLGVSKIKLTGGEPLVRLNVCDLIQEIKSIEGIQQVTITTNGVLLANMAESLIAAGIDGINISLDTLDKDVFYQLTRRDEYDNVLQGVYKLLELGYHNIKINCVPLGGVNEDQILAIAALAQQYPITVRFIELMPMGLAVHFKPINNEKIMDTLTKAYGTLAQSERKLGNGPARYYEIEGFRGTIGFIEAMSHQFCDTCNRVRLSSTGFLKLCLHYDYGIDIKQLLKEQEVATIAKELEQAIYNKPKQHGFLQQSIEAPVEQKKMFQIGG